MIDYIHDHIGESLELGSISRAAGLSEFHFARLFKAATGDTPFQFVTRTRMERAKQQLRDPKRSIIEAGLESGFQNPNHFARMFRKLEGTTPSKFRADYLSRATA